MKCVTLMALAATLALVLAPARPWPGDVSVNVDSSKLARQGTLDANACGPVSIVNMLSLGDDKCRKALAALPGESPTQRAQSLIETIGMRPSRDYAEGKRIRPEGVSCVDLTDMVCDAVAGAGLKAEGEFLDRRDSEPDRSFLLRIHAWLSGALRLGRPPLISVRSFGTAQKTGVEGEYEWNSIGQHFVVVTRVPDAVADEASGFMIEYIDPSSGRAASAYVYVERARPFLAAKGNAVKYEWKRGSPFLLVIAPELPLGTADQPWWCRTILTLNFAIRVE